MCELRLCPLTSPAFITPSSCNRDGGACRLYHRNSDHEILENQFPPCGDGRSSDGSLYPVWTIRRSSCSYGSSCSLGTLACGCSYTSASTCRDSTRCQRHSRNMLAFRALVKRRR